MKSKLLQLLVICSLILGYVAMKPKGNETQSLKDIEWLLGKWERTNVRQGTTAYEFWEKTSDNMLTGIGFSMKDKDTTFVEKLKVELKDGTLYYVADVSQNAAPVYFKFTQLTETSFVSENPDHDFPKMISYELKDGSLTAIISDGGAKKMGFVFKKME